MKNTFWVASMDSNRMAASKIRLRARRAIGARQVRKSGEALANKMPREGFGGPRGKSERLAPIGYYSRCTDFVDSGATRRQ